MKSINDSLIRGFVEKNRDDGHGINGDDDGDGDPIDASWAFHRPQSSMKK